MHTFLNSDSVIIAFFGNEYDAVNESEKIQGVIGAETLIELTQIHTDDIVVVDSSETANKQEADAIITDQKGIALMIKTADCQAFALYDIENNVIANIHVGWKSLIVDIIPKTIRKMGALYGTNPQNLEVFAIPSLGKCCSEFSNPYNEIPEKWYDYIIDDTHVDLVGIAHKQFQEADVMPENIQRMEGCTSCNTKHFYSFRKGDAQRMATVIMLK